MIHLSNTGNNQARRAVDTATRTALRNASRVATTDTMTSRTQVSNQAPMNTLIQCLLTTSSTVRHDTRRLLPATSNHKTSVTIRNRYTDKYQENITTMTRVTVPQVTMMYTSINFTTNLVTDPTVHNTTLQSTYLYRLTTTGMSNRIIRIIRRSITQLQTTIHKRTDPTTLNRVIKRITNMNNQANIRTHLTRTISRRAKTITVAHQDIRIPTVKLTMTRVNSNTPMARTIGRDTCTYRVDPPVLQQP